MARLYPVTPQEIGALLLLDELSNNALWHWRQFEVTQASVRDYFLDQLANRCCLVISGQTLASGHDNLRKPISKQVVLISPFFSDHPFNNDSEAVTITTTLSFHQVEKQVSTRHQHAPNSQISIGGSPSRYLNANLGYRHLLPTPR